MRLIAVVVVLLLALVLFVVWRRRRHGVAPRPVAAPIPDDYALALSHYDAGRSAEAESGLRQAIAARPDFPDAYFKLGNVLADLGRLDEAVNVYRDAVRLKPDFHQVHNNLGNLLRFQGRLGEAEAAFRHAIASKPDFAEAHSNLGILLVEAGRAEEAEAAFRLALRASPASFDTLFNLAQLLNDRGRPDEAEAAYRQVLRINRDFSPAANALGALLANLGRTQEAQTFFRDTLRLHPGDVGVWINLGLALADCGQSSEAEAAYRQALAIQSDNCDALLDLGILLTKTGQAEEAEAVFRQVLAAQPEDTRVHINLGNLLAQLGRPEESEAVYRQALALKPDDTDALYNYGNLLRRTHRVVEAEAAYRQALSIQPDKLEALNNLALLCVLLQRPQEALAYYQEALTFKPDSDLILKGRGHLLLLEGDFEPGWEDWEHRGQYNPDGTPRRFSHPRWDGQSFFDKTLLVHAEQGYGDNIQFFRYLPKVAAMGGRLVAECQSPLFRLFRANLPAEVQLVRAFKEPLPDFDSVCPLMSLPLHFKTRLETIPAETPYLKPPAEAVANSPVLQAKPGAPLLAGLVWAGNPAHENDYNRSLELGWLEPLFDVPGITWVILQMERRPEEFASMAGQHGWLDPMGGVQDFADTAAIIAQLDWVIGVDTALIHLAGALGKPVWLLLPTGPDWRWLQDREDSPWYPGMRLFRQREYNSWPEVIRRLAAALPAERDALLQARPEVGA